MGLGCSLGERSPCQSVVTIRDVDTKTSPCCVNSDSGVVTKTTSDASVAADEKNGDEERWREAREEELVELQREDGDGAVDEGQPPVETLGHVESGTTADTQQRLTPSFTPPTSPPPTAASPSPSTVEIRVEPRSSSSSSSSGRRRVGGSRPTSSAQRPPSDVVMLSRHVEMLSCCAVVEEPLIIRALTPATAVADQPHQNDDSATLVVDSAASANQNEGSESKISASDEDPVNGVSVTDQNRQGDDTTTSHATNVVYTTEEHSTVELQVLVQPEDASGEPVMCETKTESYKRVVFDQRVMLVSELPEQRPEMEIPPPPPPPPEADDQVEPETVNNAEAQRCGGGSGTRSRPTSSSRQTTTADGDEPAATADRADDSVKEEKTTVDSIDEQTDAAAPLTTHDVEEDESKSLESSSSMAAIRHLRDRVPTPGPRRTASANAQNSLRLRDRVPTPGPRRTASANAQNSPGLQPKSLQIEESLTEEQDDEEKNEISELNPIRQSSSQHKLHAIMRRFLSFTSLLCRPSVSVDF